MESELSWLPAWELSERVSARAVSPVEVVTELLGRIERLGPDLNPFITVMEDDALEQAARAEKAVVDGEPVGPLHGVPVSVKDNFWTAGSRTTYGSKLFESFVPDRDADFVARLRAAGAIVFAKTNLPEFAAHQRTLNLLTRECVTPWDADLGRSSGGSSGGSAVAVAAGLGPVSIGSDGGGSIRLPSALNGVVGFAASRGRVPIGPTTYHAPMQLVGPIARDVRDAALVAEVLGSDGSGSGATDGSALRYLASLDEGIQGVRIVWTSDLGYLEPMRTDVVEVARAAAEALSECDARVDDPGLRLPNLLDPFEGTTIAPFVPIEPGPDGVPSLDQYLGELRADPFRFAQCTPYVRAYAEGQIERPSLLQYAMSIHPKARSRAVDGIQDLFERFDLIASPTISCLAFVANDPEVTWQSYTAYTVMVNFLGCAAISVPAGFIDGLPVGLQLIAPPDREALLLRAARALEQVRPWAHHRPPVA